jgi:hypothetical protein
MRRSGRGRSNGLFPCVSGISDGTRREHTLSSFSNRGLQARRIFQTKPCTQGTSLSRGFWTSPNHCSRAHYFMVAVIAAARSSDRSINSGGVRRWLSLRLPLPQPHPVRRRQLARLRFPLPKASRPAQCCKQTCAALILPPREWGELQLGERRQDDLPIVILERPRKFPFAINQRVSNLEFSAVVAWHAGEIVQSPSVRDGLDRCHHLAMSVVRVGCHFCRFFLASLTPGPRRSPRRRSRRDSPIPRVSDAPSPADLQLQEVGPPRRE